MDALLLDFNGVLVNDEPLHFTSFREVLRGEGIALDHATYERDYLGMGSDWLATRVALERAGREAGQDLVNHLVERKARSYAALADEHLPLVAGAAAFVRAAAQQGRVAVVSGALRREVERGVQAAGLGDVVELIVAAEDVRIGKPDPEGFHIALRQLSARHGSSDWRAVIVEDSLPGLAAARAVGAGCVMLTTSHSAGALAAAGADLVWSSFDGHHPRELASLWRAVAE